jgi:hypothetical protein
MRKRKEAFAMNKGLCNTCEYDTKCTFQVKFPVLQCEEFSAGETKPTKVKKASSKVKQTTACYEAQEEE